MKINSDSGLVIVEGSKLRMKSDTNCGANQEKKMNTLLGSNVILAATQKQDQILISNPISTHRQKLKTKSDFGHRK